jgi:hypothetical protein
MDIPVKILGYGLKTKSQIVFHYLLPCVVEIIVYISIIVVDAALFWQHFTDKNYAYSYYTLSLIIFPALLTFLCIMVSDQWPVDETRFGPKKRAFLLKQILKFLLFPIFSTYRQVIHNKYVTYLIFL